MALIFVISGAVFLERVRWIDVVPNTLRPLLPLFDGKFFCRVMYGLRIGSGFAKRHEVVGNSHARQAGIFLDLFPQKPDRFRALHGGHWILADSYSRRVHDKSRPLEYAHKRSREVAQPDHAIALFAERQVHAVDAHAPPRREYSVKLLRQEAEMTSKFQTAAAIPHIAIAVAVGIQAFKGRREDDEVHAALRDASCYIYTVSMVNVPHLSVVLI